MEKLEASSINTCQCFFGKRLGIFKFTRCDPIMILRVFFGKNNGIVKVSRRDLMMFENQHSFTGLTENTHESILLSRVGAPKEQP